MTPRQVQVVRLIAFGYTNRMIAPMLKISVKTVEKHRQACLNAVGRHGLVELCRYAIREGHVTFEEWLNHRTPS